MERLVRGWIAVLTLFFIASGIGLATMQAMSRWAEHRTWQALMDPVEADPGLTTPVVGPTDQARRVAIGLYVERIIDLSIKDSRFGIVCDLWFAWEGDNLDPAARLVLVDGAIEKLTLLEESHVRDRHQQRYELTATVTRPFHIRHFPLDRHLLIVAFENGSFTRDKLLFVSDERNTALSSRAIVHGYRLDQLTGVEKPHTYKTSRGRLDVAPGMTTTFSQARFGVILRRDGWGLFAKMFQALFVAVAIALLPYFLRPTDLDPRFGLGVGALFAAVANAYLVYGYVPETGDFALADMVNLLGTVTILLTLVGSTISLSLFEQPGGPDWSRRLDWLSFWVMLVGFSGAITLVLLAASSAGT
ncbi:MAG: hypothetical protein EBR86_13170 [Planctomycetia bacterium]|nr:hypothetical protein [Planctomycetia bacterium]